MTIDNWNEGKKLLDEISEIETKIKNINDLLKRMEETTYECQKNVKIQLGEKYVYTPIAEVPIQEFKAFIKEIVRSNHIKIRYLLNRFESL